MQQRSDYLVRYPWHVVAGLLGLILLGWGIYAALTRAGPVAPPARPELGLATTRGLQDSGLLGVLLADFQKRTGYQVKAVVGESVQTFQLGEQGKADVLLVHSVQAEQGFMSAGVGVDRRVVMSDDLVLVGPPADPAHLGGRGILAALQKIASTGTTFVSRRDGSDTNVQELHLWDLTLGRDAQHEGWYVSTHQGMTATLMEANRRQAYAISDRATFLALARSGQLQLRIVLEKDPLLRNTYEVVRVNPQKWPDVNAAGGQAFEDYLLSDEAQRVIGSYGEAEFGQPLFMPGK